MATLFDNQFWRKLVDGALPTRQLLVEREALISGIVDCISEWWVLNPHIGPLADRVRQIAGIFDQWQRATEKVGAGLEELGVGGATGKYQAESEAFLIYMRAMDGLRRWQRLYRPKDQQNMSATLVKKLRRLCCGPDPDDPDTHSSSDRGAGISEPELETLLQRIADSGRLPSLDLKGLIKRKETARTGFSTRARSR